MRGTKEQLTDEQRCIVRLTKLLKQSACLPSLLKLNVSQLQQKALKINVIVLGNPKVS